MMALFGLPGPVFGHLQYAKWRGNPRRSLHVNDVYFGRQRGEGWPTKGTHSIAFCAYVPLSTMVSFQIGTPTLGRTQQRKASR